MSQVCIHAAAADSATTHVDARLEPQNTWSSETHALFERDLRTMCTATRAECAAFVERALARITEVHTCPGLLLAMLDERFDDVLATWLDAAHRCNALGWMVLALHCYTEGARPGDALYSHYRPLDRVALWHQIDRLLDYPRWRADTWPESTQSYATMKRMSALRKLVCAAPGVRGCCCVNCGAHADAYPEAWQRHDHRLQLNWCRVCLVPSVISRARFERMYDVDPEAHGCTGLAMQGRREPDARCYLYAELMAVPEIAARIAHATSPAGTPLSPPRKRDAGALASPTRKRATPTEARRAALEPTETRRTTLESAEVRRPAFELPTETRRPAFEPTGARKTPPPTAETDEDLY